MSSSQKFFHWTLAIFLMVSTFFYWRFPQGFSGDPGMYAYSIQELFFRYGSMFVWGASLFLKPIRQTTAKDLGVFILYIMVVSAISSFDMRQRVQILNVFFGLLFYKTVLDHFDFRFMKNMAAVFFWILYANLIFCILQEYNMDPIHQSWGNVIKGFPHKVGLVRLSEHLGTLCAILTPAIAILSPWLLIVAVPLIVYSKTSTAIVALIAALSFIIYRRKGIKFLIPFLLIIGSLGIYYVLKVDMPGGNFSYRFTVWFMGIKEVMRNSLFLGMGIGSWFSWSPQTPQESTSEPLTWLWAHNEYLQMFFELGVAGIAIILVFIKNRIKQFQNSVNNFHLDCLFAGFISVCLISITHFPFHLGRFAGIAVFSLALFHAKMLEVNNA